MARISGIELQDNWKADFALTRIKGIGWPLSRKVMKDSKVDSKKRVKDLSADDIAKITAQLENYTTEGELIRTVRGNIQRLQAIGSYRGLRHGKNLPSRGQRTKTNARTKRGKRKTVGAFKKEALAKMAPTKAEEKK
jgi:small subunit ribosomal protein S13